MFEIIGIVCSIAAVIQIGISVPFFVRALRMKKEWDAQIAEHMAAEFRRDRAHRG